MASDTTRIEKPRSIALPAAMFPAIVGVMFGGGMGTIGSAAVLKASVDRLTEQVAHLETKVENLSDGRITREEVESRMDRRGVAVDLRMEKLEERLRALESRPAH